MEQMIYETVSALSALMGVSVVQEEQSISVIEVKEVELDEHIHNAGQAIKLLAMYKQRHPTLVDETTSSELTNLERMFMLVNILGVQFKLLLDVFKSEPKGEKFLSFAYSSVKTFQKHLHQQIQLMGKVIFHAESQPVSNIK